MAQDIKRVRLQEISMARVKKYLSRTKNTRIKWVEMEYMVIWLHEPDECLIAGGETIQKVIE